MARLKIEGEASVSDTAVDALDHLLQPGGDELLVHFDVPLPGNLTYRLDVPLRVELDRTEP